MPKNIYSSEINAAAKRYGIDAGLLTSLIQSESNFDPYAINHDRNGRAYYGLGQISAPNVSALGIDPYDPQSNINASASILASFLKKYNGNTRDALANYKGGLNAVAYKQADDVLRAAGLGSGTTSPSSTPGDPTSNVLSPVISALTSRVGSIGAGAALTFLALLLIVLGVWRTVAS